jgi:hypothetical protein
MWQAQKRMERKGLRAAQLIPDIPRSKKGRNDLIAGGEATGAHGFPRLWCPGVGVGVGGTGVGEGVGAGIGLAVAVGVGVGKGRIGPGEGEPTDAGEGTRASRTSPLIGGSVTTLPTIWPPGL